MELKAIYNGEEVFIHDIKVGNIKDCKEVLVIFNRCSSRVLCHVRGDEEVLNQFTVIG